MHIPATPEPLFYPRFPSVAKLCKLLKYFTRRKRRVRIATASAEDLEPMYGTRKSDPLKERIDKLVGYHKRASVAYKAQFDTFNLCIRRFPDGDVSGIALEIFYDLNIIDEFNIDKVALARFILTVQQSYRPLPYHNWHHAVSVAHFSYILIKKLRLIEIKQLTKLEAFALVVSALTHDIDHRGTNNHFQQYVNSDIHQQFQSEGSVMERHHLALTLEILKKDNCDILRSFSPSDRQYFVELLTLNIIATDVQLHLKNRALLFSQAKSSDPRERKFARLSLFMTASDLCDNCKRWNDNLPTVRGILQEYFSQGDLEKQMGYTPVQMMDRDEAYIPYIEYQFVKYIVSPVYRYLAGIYTSLKPCVDNITRNENLWALATDVFDRHEGRVDKLDILELPHIQEDALLKTRLSGTLEDVKRLKFRSTESSARSAPVTKSVVNFVKESMSEHSEGSGVFDYDLPEEEAQTIQIRKKSRFRCFRRMCCFKKNEDE